MFVPIASADPAQAARGARREKSPGCSDWFLKLYGGVVGWFVRLRWLTVPTYLVACGLVLGVRWVCRSAPSTFHARSIRGNSCCGSRSPPGSNFELTRQISSDPKCLEEIERAEAKPEHIAITMGYVDPGRPELRHRQHGPVHARARRRPDYGSRLTEDSRDQARRIPRERLHARCCPSGCSPGWPSGWSKGEPVQGQCGEASEAVDFRFRAGRYGDPGHELRLADTDCGSGLLGTDPEDGAAARGEDRRERHERIPFLRDVRIRAVARLPHRRSHNRPRRPVSPRQGLGRGPCDRHGDGVDASFASAQPTGST